MLSFDNQLQDSLNNISFCDKKCDNLNNNKLKEKLISHLKTDYDINAVDKLFNYLNPSIIRNVTYNQHLIGTLTHGNPYLLYLVRIDGVNCCFYIDRKLKTGYQFPKIHFVQYQFNDELFSGTLFSGELIRDNQRRWFYLIDNLMLFKGEKITTKNIVCRYELIYDIFDNLYQPNSMLESCPIQIKKLFHYGEVKQLIGKFIPSLSYQCKGLLFYNLNNRYSNYALLFPRSENIIPVSNQEVGEMIKTNKPTLWAKSKENSGSNTSGGYSNQDNHIQQQQQQQQQQQHVQQPQQMQQQQTLQPSKNDPSVVLGKNNLVFKVLNTDMPDIYNLYITNTGNGELMKYDNALVPNLKTSKYLRRLFESRKDILNVKMECVYSKIFKKWTPIREVSVDISNLEDMESITNNF